MKDEGFVERTKEFYRSHTPAFIEGLENVGCEVMDSDVHFFLVRVSDDEKVIRHLLSSGIVVRHTRNFAGLEGKFIRVATGQPENNEKFVKTMRSIVHV